MISANDLFTSGWDFAEEELSLKSRYEMINIALITSGFAFIYGVLINTLYGMHILALAEAILLIINIVLFFLLRKYRNVFDLVANIITVQCTALLVYIAYCTDIESMKFTWLFTYPIVLLYFQKRNNGIYWFIFILFMLIIAPMQNFVDIKMNVFEIMYICVVLVIVSIIVHFYQIKMNEAADLIFKQQNELQNFNTELELQVEQKTAELQELNDHLEVKVKDKVEKLIAKDKLITAQSKQAVMGEMISMIAHQWRQPLSTITLQISNLHFKKMMGNKIEFEDIDKTLSEISETIVYLSDTINDFQTYFRPNKEQEEIKLHELIQKAINFILPRGESKNVKIVNDVDEKIIVYTYVNEMIQVILNLVNNAIDAFAEQNKTGALLILYAKEKEDSVVVYIEDNAGGISDENLPHIFEPYFSTKGKNGTGLGLYMSQMIIEKQFHGELKVKTSSTGATFSVEISKKVL